MYHDLFIHSPIEGYLGCPQFETITNKAARNIHVQVLCGHKFSCQLYKYLGTRLLGHKLISFVRNRQTVLQSCCTILDSHRQHKGEFLLLHIPPGIERCLSAFSPFLYYPFNVYRNTTMIPSSASDIGNLLTLSSLILT